MKRCYNNGDGCKPVVNAFLAPESGRYQFTADFAVPITFAYQEDAKYQTQNDA